MYTIHSQEKLKVMLGPRECPRSVGALATIIQDHNAIPVINIAAPM